MNTNKKSKSEHQANLLQPLPVGDCQCEWLADNSSFFCAGCENEVRPFRDTPIHWRGSHWHLKCAFVQTQEELQAKEKMIAELKTNLDLASSKKQKSELAESATKFYFEHLEKILEPEHIGEFVSIDPESGNYFVGKTMVEAMQKAREVFPDKILFMIKIGYDAAVKFSGFHRPRNHFEEPKK